MSIVHLVVGRDTRDASKITLPWLRFWKLSNQACICALLFALSCWSAQNYYPQPAALGCRHLCPLFTQQPPPQRANQNRQIHSVRTLSQKITFLTSHPDIPVWTWSHACSFAFIHKQTYPFCLDKSSNVFITENMDLAAKPEMQFNQTEMIKK